MNSEQVKVALQASKVIAILRKVSYDDAISIARTVVESGIRAIEVTMDGEDAPRILSTLRDTMSDEIVIGAGTVMDVKQGEEALSRGASVLFSPHFDSSLVEHFVGQGVPFIPGVATPTEMIQATRAGASILKLFPAASLGASYLKDVLGPLAGTSFVPTGGITNDNAGDFIRNGAIAVGMGSSLVPKSDVSAGNWDAIRNRVRSLLEALA